jgi:hypothetical protein
MLSVPKPSTSMLAAAPLPSDPRIVKLVKPIKTHQGEQREITLREPIASDYVTCDVMPFKIIGNGDEARIDVQFKPMMKWATLLTGHDEIVLGNLSGPDWLEMTRKINGMLVETMLSGGNLPT